MAMGEEQQLTGAWAQPFEYDPVRWAYLLEKVCEHRPWFHDKMWESEEGRRQAAVAFVAEALTQGHVWEVFRGTDLVGIILINRVDYGNEAYCHFVFFDKSLADKRQLCLNVMAWLFQHLELETLRVQVPTYAFALAKWVRRKLGFRYETEDRPLWGTDKTLTMKEAELGSRKVRATLYKGTWHDVLLLSITREEFQDYYGRSTIRRAGESDEGGTEPTAV
jgi:RimJ/RimL family protein N-acetyltransferase